MPEARPIEHTDIGRGTLDATVIDAHPWCFVMCAITVDGKQRTGEDSKLDGEPALQNEPMELEIVRQHRHIDAMHDSVGRMKQGMAASGVLIVGVQKFGGDDVSRPRLRKPMGAIETHQLDFGTPFRPEVRSGVLICFLDSRSHLRV